MTSVAQQIRLQYVYDFAALGEVPAGPTSAKVAAKRLLSGPTLQTGKSSTVGAVLTGSNIIVALAGQARGSGAKPHTHPNEQFNYILQGTMTGEISGELVFAPAGTLMHTPAQAVHTGLACPDEDLIFLAMKDTRHGIVGPPVDGKYDGPNYLPGFGTRTGERMKSTAELMAESGRDPAGVKIRYIYDFTHLNEKPGRTSSAMVTQPMGLMPGSSATGPVVTGEMLHVGVLRFAPGAAIAGHAHKNEQFTFIVEGDLEADLDGERLRVGERCALHVPAGLKHSLAAPRGALAVTVQDTRYPYAG